MAQASWYGQLSSYAVIAQYAWVISYLGILIFADSLNRLAVVLVMIWGTVFFATIFWCCHRCHGIWLDLAGEWLAIWKRDSANQSRLGSRG